jgi:hypothetical protein
MYDDDDDLGPIDREEPEPRWPRSSDDDDSTLIAWNEWRERRDNERAE